jgi:hypothetical protein
MQRSTAARLAVTAVVAAVLVAIAVILVLVVIVAGYRRTHQVALTGQLPEQVQRACRKRAAGRSFDRSVLLAPMERCIAGSSYMFAFHRLFVHSPISSRIIGIYVEYILKYTLSALRRKCYSSLLSSFAQKHLVHRLNDTRAHLLIAFEHLRHLVDHSASPLLRNACAILLIDSHGSRAAYLLRVAHRL